jgi:hypothetical protein
MIFFLVHRQSSPKLHIAGGKAARVIGMRYSSPSKIKNEAFRLDLQADFFSVKVFEKLASF